MTKRNVQNVTELRPRKWAGDAERPDRVGPLNPPAPLSEFAWLLWNEFVEPAKHLHADSALKAFAWVALGSEMLADPAKFSSARFSQLRQLGNELGIGHVSRGEPGRTAAPAAIVDPSRPPRRVVSDAERALIRGD